MELLWIPFFSILTKKKNKWKIIWVPIFFDDGQPIRPFQYRFGVIEKDKWIKFWRSTWCRLRVLPTFFFTEFFFHTQPRKRKSSHCVPGGNGRFFLLLASFFFFLNLVAMWQKRRLHLGSAHFFFFFSAFFAFFFSPSLFLFIFFYRVFRPFPPPPSHPHLQTRKTFQCTSTTIFKVLFTFRVFIVLFIFVWGGRFFPKLVCKNSHFILVSIKLSTIDIFLGDFFCFLFKKKKCRIEAVVAAEVGELLFFFCRNLKDFFVRC